MIRPGLYAALLCLLPVIPTALAQDEHDHEASIGSLTIVHPWARAAAAGEDTLVFLEIDNDGAAVQLAGAETGIASSVEIVGAALGADGKMIYQSVGAVQIAPGHFALEPDGLGLRLTGLSQDLVAGDEFELEVMFGNGDHLDLHVEVEAADATAHSHAGHSH
tara:strand:- start:12111 stop:12599 length:489 start_codon:yes stop_codon:yes gene_type:complete